MWYTRDFPSLITLSKLFTQNVGNQERNDLCLLRKHLRCELAGISIIWLKGSRREGRVWRENISVVSPACRHAVTLIAARQNLFQIKHVNTVTSGHELPLHLLWIIFLSSVYIYLFSPLLSIFGHRCWVWPLVGHASRHSDRRHPLARGELPVQPAVLPDFTARRSGEIKAEAYWYYGPRQPAGSPSQSSPDKSPP